MVAQIDRVVAGAAERWRGELDQELAVALHRWAGGLRRKASGETFSLAAVLSELNQARTCFTRSPTPSGGARPPETRGIWS
jgi:hypothetical protein